MSGTNFPQKLQLVLKVLVISRTGLAAALGVDKSLVGRWASGAVKPSNHNLANLTRFIGEKIPDFTILDWEHDMGAFSARLGLAEAKTSSAPYAWVPDEFQEEGERRAEMKGPLYTGLWRSTRPSHDLPGRFIHDISMISTDEHGRFRLSIGTELVRYHGWSMMLGNQFFGTAYDLVGMTAMFSIFQGVAHQRPMVLDGINLATLRDAGGSPTASRCVLQRIGELSGNPEDDNALFERTVAQNNPLAPEGSIDPELAAHLTTGVIGEAEGILRVLYSQALSRGPTLSEVAEAASN